MRYVRLGNTDLEVSRLGLDCHSLGVTQRERGWDPSSYDGEVFAIRTVHAALDAGINIFDTTSGAGGARAEALLGKALRDRRESALLASRLCQAKDGDAVNDSVSASLRRLRADHLDIVYLGDHLDQMQHPLNALVRLRKRGVVRYLGLVVSDPVKALPLVATGEFDVVELQCSVADEDAVSTLLNTCQQKGLGVSIIKPLASRTLQTLAGILDAGWVGSNKVRECCLRYLLSDPRIHFISLGMRWEHEVATNSRMVADIEPAYIPLAASS
ncbi:MAG: aldo/keto reductase [Woeseiaceae bacterium]|nr:aldo/keto reductase [Woeseiaceae bacterium]